MHPDYGTATTKRNRNSHAPPVIPCVLLVLILVSPKNAFAYIDPNTGGYVFQVLFPLVSVVLAGYVFFRDKTKKFVASIRYLISSLFR